MQVDHPRFPFPLTVCIWFGLTEIRERPEAAYSFPKALVKVRCICLMAAP